MNKGHCIVYFQPPGGQSWALFDDHIVKWVKEEEILLQEASLLIYSRTTAPSGREADQPTSIM
jgi:hypothetical protein